MWIDTVDKKDRGAAKEWERKTWRNNEEKGREIRRNNSGRVEGWKLYKRKSQL